LAFKFSTDFLLKKKPRFWFFFRKLGLGGLNENKTAPPQIRPDFEISLKQKNLNQF